MGLLRCTIAALCVAIAIAGPPHLAEGEAAVVRRDGERWTIVARIRVEDWPKLVAAAK